VDNDSGGGVLVMVVHVTMAWCIEMEAVVGMCCSTEGLEERGGASVG
jgi:hypothetical protein